MRLRVYAFTAMVALGCLLLAAGAAASDTQPDRSGNAIVQAVLNYDARVGVGAPACALSAATATAVAVFVVTAVLFFPELAGYRRGAVFATAIRPPPIA